MTEKQILTIFENYDNCLLEYAKLQHEVNQANKSGNINTLKGNINKFKYAIELKAQIQVYRKLVKDLGIEKEIDELFYQSEIE